MRVALSSCPTASGNGYTPGAETPPGIGLAVRGSSSSMFASSSSEERADPRLRCLGAEAEDAPPEGEEAEAAAAFFRLLTLFLLLVIRMLLTLLALFFSAADTDGLCVLVALRWW